MCRRRYIVAFAGLATVACVILQQATARAAATGDYGIWSIAGASGAWTGSVIAAAAGFPLASLASTTTNLQTPTGASAFLDATTPFGGVFGTSRNHPYLNVGTAAGQTPSTTTITFATPTPASGWGFAVGDVDADSVQVAATDANGPVAVSALGWQGAFNYCAVSPKPSSCTGPGPFTDVPTWDPATGTVVGSGVDTLGAAGWFEPSAALTSITFTFTRLAGIPIFQLWLASLSVPLSGQVGGVTPDSAIPSPGIQLDLLHADKTPVVDPAGQPVIATADDTGTFEFPSVVDGSYLLDITTPETVTSTGDAQVAVTVDVSSGEAVVAPGTFTVVAGVQPTPTTSSPAPTAAPPATTAHPSNAATGSAASTTATTVTAAAEPALAATGVPVLAIVALANALVAAGLVVSRAGSRRRGGRERR